MSALLLAVLQVVILRAGPAAAGIVSTVRGEAFGYFASVSLFGGPPSARGPSPTVTTPYYGAPVTVTHSSASVQYGPATLFTSGLLELASGGSIGDTGSVTTTTRIQTINTSGDEVFTAAQASSTCTASETSLTGSTTITGGTLRTSEGSPNVVGDEVVIALPADPAPNTTYNGQIETVGDSFRYVFNEQVLGADGSLTVNTAHLYLLGPTAVGDLIIGQSVCGVRVEPGPNRAPTAVDDSYSTAHGTPLSVAAPGVLSNDSDVDGDPLSAAPPTQPVNGTVALDSDGGFTYTPDAGFSGADTFTYAARDPSGSTTTATVTITVGAPPPQDRQSVAGTTFYDVNTNGTRDVGEPAIAHWPIDVTSSAAAQTVVTGADGAYTADVPTGAVTVAERLPSRWLQTAPPGGRYDVTVHRDQHLTDLHFGNVCIGSGGGHSKGYWTNKNGQSTFARDPAAALRLLGQLHLRDADGSHVDPRSYGQYRDWLRAANAANAAHMLSAQLSALALDVHFGFVDRTSLVHAPGAASANTAGFSTVDRIMEEADAALAAHGSTTAGDPHRSGQLMVSEIIDAANDDRSFVRPTAAGCPAP